jgi:hypothetical protein
MQIAPLWDWVISLFFVFSYAFSQPNSNFLDQFAEDMADMATIVEHHSRKHLDEKIEKNKRVKYMAGL